jgi:hypothetical protein
MIVGVDIPAPDTVRVELTSSWGWGLGPDVANVARF